jgi:fumarate reductase subunit D
MRRVIKLLEQIVGVLFLLAMIVFPLVGVRQCADQIDTARANLPTYRVRYHSFLNGSASYDFETYTD